MLRKLIHLLIGSALLAAAAACQLAQTPPPEPSATPAPTDTPRPTDTPTPTFTPTSTETPEPTATATPTPDRTETAVAQVTGTAEAAIAEIQPVLAKYDLTTQGGHLGWLHDPLTLKVNTYLEEKRHTDYPDFVVADFVFYTEMTWETSTGFAGCGVVLRTESDIDRGKQYRIYMARLQGLPVYSIEYTRHDRFERSVSSGIKTTGALYTDQGATNEITFILQGNKLAFYANGDRVGIFTDSALTEGNVAFMAFQESGETTCTFENSWLWVLGQGE